jgi:PAS domain S-box-containing protein
MSHQPRAAPVARFVAVAVAFFLTSVLGVNFIVMPEQLLVLWPPVGLLLGYFLATDRRHWAGGAAAAFVGDVVFNLTSGQNVGVGVGFAAMNALEPLATAWVIVRLRGAALRLGCTRDVLWLFAGPMVVCAGGALLGAGLVVVAFGAPSYWAVWRVWWLGGAVGAILFAPLVLAWGLPAGRARGRARALERVALLAVLGAVVWGIFLSDLRGRYGPLALPFPVFPLLVWVALRSDLRGTTVAVVVASLAAAWGTMIGRGPIADLSASAADRVLVTQAFVAAVCLSSLVLVTALQERHAAENEFRGQRQILRTILDSMGEAVLVADASGKVLLTNAAFDRLHADTAGKAHPAPAQWQRAYGVYLPDGTTPCPDDLLPLSRAIRGEECDDLRFVIVNGPNPHGVPVSITARPMLGPTGVEGGVVAVRDISAAVRAEAALRASEHRFRAIFHAQFQFIGLLSPAGVLLEANRGALALIGAAEADVVGKPFWDAPWWAHDAAERDRVRAAVRHAADGGRARFETHHPTAERGTVWVDFSLSAFRDEAGAVVFLIPEGRDITERKRHEAALRESEERYRSVVESLAEGVVVQDAAGAIIASNARAGEILGLSREQIAGRTSLDPDWEAIREDGTPLPGDGHPAMVALRTGRPVFNVVMGVRKPTREYTWMTVNAVPIGGTGAAGAVVASFHDITESRGLHQRVTASLREKEVLLREIHHRVKNNLQIVSTLLDLQSDFTADARALEMFRESRGRVKSMALIHERLYRSEDLARVEFGDYIRRLADDLYRTYKVSDDEVRLDLDVCVPPLAIDTAIPCGLLLNELVSNCFKHAFPDGRAGTVRVALVRGAGGTTELTVADDGAGFPAGVDFRNTTSFGLQLVNTLTEQLAGTLELTTGAGTTVTVRFPTAAA